MGSLVVGARPGPGLVWHGPAIPAPHEAEEGGSEVQARSAITMESVSRQSWHFSKSLSQNGNGVNGGGAGAGLRHS